LSHTHGDKALIGDREHVAQFGDELVLASEIRVWRRHSLQLDEPPKPLDMVKMDTNVAPEEQTPALDDHDLDPDRGGERDAEHRPVLDLDDPVAALALLRLVGALELDQVRSTRTLFSELQAAVGHLEIGVPLPDLAVVLGADLPAHLKRAIRFGIECLTLDIPLRLLCWIDCYGVLAISSAATRVLLTRTASPHTA